MILVPFGIEADSYLRMHIFYSRRCLDIKDGKTKWAELDEKSDEISETG